MKKLIASAAVLLVVSASAFASTYVGTASWNSLTTSPFDACAKQFPGSMPGGQAQTGVNGWIKCYK